MKKRALALPITLAVGSLGLLYSFCKYKACDETEVSYEYEDLTIEDILRIYSEELK